MSQTGAEHLIDTLIQAGVKHLFSLSGNQILSLYDATIGREINLIHTRHEATAVHMADAWGRLTNEPGIALLTAGPGHCNGLSALYVALMAESPLVMLSGHAPLAQLGQGAFQEIDQVSMAKPVTKASWLVEDAHSLPENITRAMNIAQTGKPGPVHLSLPDDVLKKTVSASRHDQKNDQPSTPRPPEKTLVQQTLAHLQQAKRPLILAGPAMGRTPRWGSVAHLSDVTQIPALPMESPRGVNDPSLHKATHCLAEADLVLLIGKSLDFSLKFGQMPFFAPSCRFIQIEADQQPDPQTDRVILKHQADLVQFTQALATMAQTLTWSCQSWRAEVKAARQTVPAAWQEIQQTTAHPMHPLQVCEALQPFLDQDAVLVSDGGEFGQWVQADLSAPTRLINGPSGSIGSALPMGIAAKLVYPQKSIFVTLGDGTFGYHALDMDTALRYQLPIVVIIGNDARWNAEHQLQLQHYGPERTVGCTLLPSRYDQVITALGGHGEFVQQANELPEAIERSLASDLPACVNVMIDSVGTPVF